MNSPGQQVLNILLEIKGEITPERIKRWGQRENNAQLWMRLVTEVKSDAVEKNTAQALSGECMLLGSVSLQQRFGVTDIKALGVSQLSGLG